MLMPDWSIRVCLFFFRICGDRGLWVSFDPEKESPFRSPFRTTFRLSAFTLHSTRSSAFRTVYFFGYHFAGSSVFWSRRLARFSASHLPRTQNLRQAF